MELDIIDLKDLQAMTAYVGEHSKEYTTTYGNVSKQSVGAIQRKLLQLETDGGDKFFGMPSLNIDDWMTTEGGMGMMNMLECEELFQHPLLYSAFLLWMLDELYNRLPEVGDAEKPKMVFFFDEAHLLFDDAPKRLVDKIEQTIKLIRSKGVGVFFCTQSPSDISKEVLAQLSNRIQHSLRAYTPAEIKTVKMAADSFRQNPDLDTVETITNMKTGTALVSVLDEEGAPTIVQKTKILPPKSSMSIAPEETVMRYIENDSIYGKYEKAFDPESAYEEMENIYRQEEAEKEAAEEEKRQAKLREQQERAEAREQAKREKEKAEWGNRLAKKAKSKLENEALNIGIRSARKFLKGLLK
jgi:DNA helicase HerA-like ATPase